MNKVVELVAPKRLGRPFRGLLASSWLSNLGDGLAIAAGPLLVASETDSRFLVAFAALLNWLPNLLFSLIAGVVSDRFDRRRIVISVNIVRVAVLVALAAMIASGTVTIALVLSALFVLGVAETFADTATSTLLPMIVHRDDLALANSRVMAGFITVNMLVGPPIGAFLFVAGRAWPAITQAVLIAAAVVVLGRVAISSHLVAGVGRDDQRAGGTAPAGGIVPANSNGAAAGEAPAVGDDEQRADFAQLRRDLMEGLRFVRHHAAVRTLVLTISMFNITFGAAWSILVLYATERLGLGERGFGLVTTVQAAGGLVATVGYGWLTRRVSLGNLMRVGLIIEAGTHLLLAVITSSIAAMVVFFVFGAHAFVWGTTSITIRQRAVPLELQGRVNSVNRVGVSGGLVVGAALGGVIAERWGVTAPFWFAGVGSAIFVVAIWRQLTNVAHADAVTVAVP